MRPCLLSGLLEHYVQNQLTSAKTQKSVAAALCGNLEFLFFFTAPSWLGSVSEATRELDVPKKQFYLCAKA